jgi:FtsH-binding integral membrane protein
MKYAQHNEAPMKDIHLSNLLRQTHRWLSIIFTLTVIANFIAMALGTPAPWVVYSPLPPLFLMLVTGLYMFALPYLRKRRAGGVGVAALGTTSPAPKSSRCRKSD